MTENAQAAFDADRHHSSGGTRWSDVNKFFVIALGILTFIGAMFTVGGVCVGILYGYFSLQRNTADNTTNLSRVEAKFDMAIDALKKGQADGQDKLLAVIREGQERQSREFSEYAKKADDRMAATDKKTDERMAAAERETFRIDRDGTNYGKTKVDGRMQEIAEVRTRVEKVEESLGKILPTLNRIDDRVEQMWGEYNARNNNAPPQIDTRRARAR